jgi:arylformamidase
VESLSLDILVGPVCVVQVPDEVQVVGADVLENAAIPSGTQRLLLKTNNSHIWERRQNEFFTGFVGISADGADWLVQHGINLIGIDYLSVAPYKQSVPTHRTLLEAGLIILEGLDLSGVQAGDYHLYCLPLKLVGSDGAPARAILVA